MRIVNPDVKTAVNFGPVDDALSKREYQREFEGNRRLRKFEEFRSRHVSHCDQIRTTAVRFSREDNHYPANRGPSTVYSRWDFSQKRSIVPQKTTFKGHQMGPYGHLINDYNQKC